MKFLLALLVLVSSLSAQALEVKLESSGLFVGRNNPHFHVRIDGDHVAVGVARMRPRLLKIVKIDDLRPLDGDLKIFLVSGDMITVGSGFNIEGTQPIHFVSKAGGKQQLIPQISVQIVE